MGLPVIMEKAMLVVPQLNQTHSVKNRALLRSIEKKKEVLKKLVLQTETLKVKLDMVKQEYMFKVGSLIIKDNQLDLKIMHYRNIIRLMKDGLTYQEAVDELATSFFAEELAHEEEQERIRVNQHNREKEKSQTPQQETNLKKLWRELIAAFHPDLVLDKTEKERRTKIMTEVNRAYEERDYDGLVSLQREYTITLESPVYTLEETLIMIENEIINQQKRLLELRNSEWYRLEQKMQRSKKTIDEIFKDMEKSLLDTIAAKLEVIQSLRKHLPKEALE